MNVDIIYSLAFGLWAGVVGLGIRAVLARLDNLAGRVMEIEKALVRIDTEMHRQ